MSLSIRQKLYATLFVGAILPLSVMALWLARGAERAGTALLREQMNASLDRVMRSAEQRWFYRYGDLLLLAGNQVVLEALALPTPPTSPPAYLVDLFGSLDRGIRRATYYDRTGREVWSFGSDIIPAAARGAPDRAAFIATSVVPTRIEIRDPRTAVRLGELRAEVHVNALIPDSLTTGVEGSTLAVFERSSRAILLPTQLPPDVLQRESFELAGESWLVSHDTLSAPPLAFAIAAPRSTYIAPFRRVARNGIVALLLVGCAVSVLTAWLTARVMRSTLDQLARSQSLAAVGQYAASLSHEIRNALTSIRVDLQRVEQRDIRPDDQSRLVQRALHNILRLDGIVNSSLRIARSGTLDLQPVSLLVPLKQAVQLSEHEFADRGLHVELRVSPTVRVIGNSAALQQLFLNLLLNGAQANGSVVVEVAETDDTTTVTVTDNGCGMTASAPGSSGRSSKPNGSGLGLAIARDIVRAHDGKIHFESRSGRTVVTVVLRAAPAAAFAFQA